MSSCTVGHLSLLFLLLFITSSSTVKGYSQFDSSQNETLTNILVVDTNSLLVGSTSRIYRLQTSSLTVQSAIELTQSNRLLLQINNTGSDHDVLSCQVNSCFFLDPSNLNKVSVTSPSVTSIIFPATVNIPGVYAGDIDFFVAKDANDPLSSTISKLNYTGTQLNLIGRQQESSFFNKRDFLTFFRYQKFVYYVFVVRTNSDTTLQVARVCSNDTGVENNGLSLTTYTEAQLVCTGVNPQNVTSATFIESTRIILVSGGSMICGFNITEINERMDNKLTSCTNGIGTTNLKRGSTGTCPTDLEDFQKNRVLTCSRQGTFSIPLEVETPTDGVQLASSSTQVYSLRSHIYENTIYVFAGTNRTIEQFYYSITDNSLIFIRSIALTGNDTVNDFVFSTDGELIFTMTSSYVDGRPVNVCGDKTSCSECIQSNDPVCGWCTLSSRCTKRDDCTTAPQVWQTEIEQCPSINTVDPTVVYTDQLINSPPLLTLNVSNIPRVSYSCVYKYGSGINNSISTATIADTNRTITCLLPSATELPPFGNQNAIFVNVSLRTSNNIDVISLTTGQGIAFTNCSILTSCSTCLGSLQQCNWCPLANSCTSPITSCTPSLSGTAIDNCPLIQPPNQLDTSDYLIHVNISQPLIIQSRNLDIYNTTNYRVVCVLSNSQGSVLYELEGTVSRFSVICQETTFNVDLDSVTNLNISSLQVQVHDGNRILQIENLNNSKVIFYSCILMGDNCGQCLSIASKFECGYCSTSSCIPIRLTECNGATALSGINDVGGCPTPTIERFSPTAGPINGGTNITIYGENLGADVTQIQRIQIGEVDCDHLTEQYQPGKRIICTTRTTITGVVAATVNITFTFRSGKIPSRELFQFLIPRFDTVPASPSVGPLSGGTRVTVSGAHLGIGNTRSITLAGQKCVIEDEQAITVDATNITCTSVSKATRTTPGQGAVGILIDGTPYFAVGFDYESDPSFKDISPKSFFKSGGTVFTLTGSEFDTVQEPRMIFYYQPLVVNNGKTNDDFMELESEPCTRQDSTMMCTAPPLTSSVNSTDIEIGLRMDNVFLLRQLNVSVKLHDDPVFDTTFNEQLSPGEARNLTFKGSGFFFTYDQVRVFVSRIPCLVENGQVTNTTLTCHVEIDGTAADNDEYPVTVSIGNFQQIIGTVTIRESINLTIILIPCFAGFVILLIVIFIVIVSVFYRKYKQKDEQNDRLLFELERLESSVAYECKLGFAELQTDLGELTGDIAGTRLPYHDLHSYLLQSLFPGSKDHPTLHPPVLPTHTKHRIDDGIHLFYSLLMDKTVLLNIVHTLEGQRQFNIRDKSNFGSLLMIALHDKLDYATEILKRLLSDLVRRTVAESYPKLLLRRTESVAEKMLSSWLAFTLHGYVVEHTGQPLYLLYKAVKAQLEKGPIDVITGEARYSLSEQKLIRQSLDIQVINATVETEDGVLVPVKLIDCDSISQAKEKMLDAVFKNTPVSQRPPLTSIDIEYCRSPNDCMILRDEDGSNISEYGWRRINTLRHYWVSEKAIFRLVPRDHHAGPGRVFDYTGSLMVSHGHRTRTLSDGEDGTRIWHLFKQVDEDPRSSPFMSKKMVTEIYLPRMLSTKTILQQFVDDLFNSIFTLSHPPTSPSHLYTPVATSFASAAGNGHMTYAPGSDSLPLAIKYLFDLLDDEAMSAKISDADVVHTWKNNSLALRFWVNLIKNPEFVFDINKSAIVDACLSVIAQAFIDGCSSSDTRPTINSPTSKLLYNKEVQGYKNSVKLFYEEIQSLPRIPEEMMMQHLKDMSAHQANQFRKSKQGFNVESAVYEILRYAIKYQDPILQSLRDSGLEAKAQLFENVLHFST